MENTLPLTPLYLCTCPLCNGQTTYRWEKQEIPPNKFVIFVGGHSTFEKYSNQQQKEDEKYREIQNFVDDNRRQE
jgi:hypothetical protein